jgi:hypothetical protein
MTGQPEAEAHVSGEYQRVMPDNFQKRQRGRVWRLTPRDRAMTLLTRFEVALFRPFEPES